MYGLPPDVEKTLRKGFERRWQRLVNRSKVYGVPLPAKEMLFRKVVEVYKQGFICEYCGAQMILKPPKGCKWKIHPHVWSIDHRVSFSEGGTNELSNIAIVCTRCNLVKGTFPDFAFKIMIQALREKLGEEGYEKVMTMAYRGALANKIDRMRAEGLVRR